MNTRGSDAETLAADFLQRAGLTLVTRNYRCRYGEIDIIARDGNTLIFAEVRMRSTASFGGAAASITATKQAKIISAAQHYLTAYTAQKNKMPACRFDALLVNGDGQIEWLRNAFEA